MKQFCWGMLAMASLVAGLLFLRYWKVTGERLFAFFAMAFAMLSINYLVLAAVDPAFEARHLIFLIRLAGFVLIIIGIVDKNREVRATRGW
jgi:membrane protein DedA with SNARE-associated domain